MNQNDAKKKGYNGFLQKIKVGLTRETHTGLSFQSMGSSDKVSGAFLYHFLTHSVDRAQPTMWCWLIP